jgi:triacylglycerol lipase
MRTMLTRSALALAALVLLGGGGVAWYWRFLERLPAEFETPVDQARSKLAGYSIPVTGWGGGGSGATRTPIIFLHGTTGAAWNWGIARALFRLWGYQPDELWAVTYGWGGEAHLDPQGVLTGDDSVDENLAELDQFVRAVLGYVQRQNPAIQQVDLVGHSMGGVLARRWLREGDNARLVRRLVALDSPNHGIDENWLRQERCPNGWTQFCADFVLGSPWLAALNAPPEVPASVRALAVYDGTGQHSFTATPWSPRIEGGDNLPYNLARGTSLSHTAYIYDPGVLRAIFDWLQAP